MGHRRVCVWCSSLFLLPHPSNIIIVGANKSATNSRGLQHLSNSNDCTNNRNALLLTTNEDVMTRYNLHFLLHRSFRPLERIIGRRRSRLTQQRKQQPPMQSKKRQMYLTCFAIVFVWISSGTLFYSNYYQWPLSQSFFYAVDAGMSIGFCTDVAETDVGSRAFTIVHILLGASCVGGALVLLVQSALEGVASRSAAVYRLILERDSLKKAFMAGGVSDIMPSPVLLLYPKDWVLRFVQRREEGVLSYDHFRIVLKSNGLRSLTDREFQHVCSLYDPCGDGYIRYECFASKFEGIHRILPTSRFFVYYNNSRALPVRIIVKAWDASTTLLTNENYRIYWIFVLWVSMGIIWGIYNQGWDPITATHFAVSALATGGLTAPPVDPLTGVMPAGSALFCGFYCLFGIPLMALTLGLFARVLVEKYIIEEELVALAKPLSQSEYRFASKSLCSTDNAIHLSDYIVLQLMRQGKLSVDSFEFMKRQYQTLDQRRSIRRPPPLA